MNGWINNPEVTKSDIVSKTMWKIKERHMEKSFLLGVFWSGTGQESA